MAEAAFDKLVAILHSIFNSAAIEQLLYTFVEYWFQVVAVALVLWATIHVFKHILSPARERHWLRR